MTTTKIMKMTMGWLVIQQWIWYSSSVVTTAFSHWTHTNKSIDIRLPPPASHSWTEWEIIMMIMCMGDDILRCNRYRHNCTVWSSHKLRLRDTCCTCMIQSNMWRALVPTSILVDACYVSIQRLPKWRVCIVQPTCGGCNSCSKGEC